VARKAFQEKALERRGRFTGDDGSGVKLTYVSADGEEGYPGELSCRGHLHPHGEKRARLGGQGNDEGTDRAEYRPSHLLELSAVILSTKINDHELTIYADRYLATNAGMIPTGELAPVAGTPLDLQKPTVIGKRIDADHEALKLRRRLRPRLGPQRHRRRVAREGRYECVIRRPDGS
jgi:hypothetical protein